MTPTEQHLQNDLDGLQFIHQFTWLRTHELGPLLWPSSHHSRHQANRLVRNWLKRRLVIERTLPERSGRAIVLATAGVRLLAEHGIHATTGKDFGEMQSNAWTPPSTWRHDLIAHGVLVDLYLKGFSISPEAEIRRNEGHLKKLPDGLAWKDGEVVWLEVEHSRKTGAAMKHLVQTLSTIAEGTAPPILGMSPSHAMVAFAPDQTDERAYALDHKYRVKNAVSATVLRAVPIYWAECSIRCAGVYAVRYTDDVIEADKPAAIQRQMEVCGWRREADALICRYGARVAFVWEDDEANAWGWQVDDIPAERVNTVTEAKRRCAELIASLKA